MQAKLIVTGGKANKREVVITLPATIGRSSDADLTVGHRMISRKHCEAYLVDGLMMIRDAGSLNGTYVHGRRIREAPLPPDEKFTIGPITFQVSYEYSGDRSKLPAIVPAEAAAAEDTLDEPSANGESAEASTGPAQEATYAIAADDEKADSQVSTARAGSDDEPDFEMVDNDFELAVQEDLQNPKQEPEPKQPSPEDAGQKPAEKKDESGKDPEDQLMDDFLNDLQ